MQAKRNSYWRPSTATFWPVWVLYADDITASNFNLQGCTQVPPLLLFFLMIRRTPTYNLVTLKWMLNSHHLASCKKTVKGALFSPVCIAIFCHGNCTMS